MTAPAPKGLAMSLIEEKCRDQTGPKALVATPKVFDPQLFRLVRSPSAL
jgi:hypothetical protein